MILSNDANNNIIETLKEVKETNTILYDKIISYFQL